MKRAPALALAALLTSSCGAALMKLPQGPSGSAATGATDADQIFKVLLAGCSAVSSISAEAAVSGSVGGQRVRVRLNVGLARPDSARVEALAFGQPVFVFVSRAGDATLLLQQENRVLERGPADAILEAVTGVPVGPGSLRDLLTGCAIPPPDGFMVFAPANNWRVGSVNRAHAYLHQESAGKPWQLVAVRHHDSSGAEWRVEYRNFVRGLATDVRLRSEDGKRFDLRLTLSQVALNETFDDRAFRIQVPAGADPMTLQELRDSGPLAGASQGR